MEPEKPVDAPDRVAELCRALVGYVERALGMTLDYAEETLPVVDHYLAQARSGGIKPEVVDLIAPAAGCYFGEVIRRKVGGRWVLEGEPAQWRLELEPCFLYFYPVGMAAEAIVGNEAPGYDGSFATSDAQTAVLHDALEAAAPVDEQTYYSLAGRLEIIQHAVDFLVALGLEVGQPHRYDAQAYRRAVAAREAAGQPN